MISPTRMIALGIAWCFGFLGGFVDTFLAARAFPEHPSLVFLGFLAWIVSWVVFAVILLFAADGGFDKEVSADSSHAATS